MKVRRPVTTFYDPYTVMYRSTLGGRVVIVVDRSRQDRNLSRREVVSEEEWKSLMKETGSVRRAAKRLVQNSTFYQVGGEEA